MPRMLAPGDGAVQLEVARANGGVDQYRGNRPIVRASQVAALKAGGYTLAPLLGATRSRARVCIDCGFVGHFTTCGRCGGHAERETL